MPMFQGGLGVSFWDSLDSLSYIYYETYDDQQANIYSGLWSIRSSTKQLTYITIIFVSFEAGSHYVAKTVPRFESLLILPTSDGITGMCH